VSYISLKAWEQIALSEDMRDVESSLVNKAKEFACSKGMYAEVLAELDLKPDCGNCDEELQLLENGQLHPSVRQQ